LRTWTTTFLTSGVPPLRTTLLAAEIFFALPSLSPCGVTVGVGVGTAVGVGVGGTVGVAVGVVVGVTVGVDDTITQGKPIGLPKIVQWWHWMLGGDPRVYWTVTDSPGSTQATNWPPTSHARLNPP
jgi:hypothetical protein